MTGYATSIEVGGADFDLNRSNYSSIDRGDPAEHAGVVLVVT